MAGESRPPCVLIRDAGTSASVRGAALPLPSLGARNWLQWKWKRLTLVLSHMRSVQEMPGVECFPDSSARVFGAASATLPDVLTT